MTYFHNKLPRELEKLMNIKSFYPDIMEWVCIIWIKQQAASAIRLLFQSLAKLCIKVC